MLGDLTIRKIFTGSGATAVQVVQCDEYLSRNLIKHESNFLLSRALAYGTGLSNV
jgi:hypothetical protein